MAPMEAFALAAVVLLLLLTLFFGYVVPLLWKYLLRPLGKMAYFLLLLLVGISFFALFFLGKHYAIPEPIQVGLGIFAAVVAGIKWATKRY